MLSSTLRPLLELLVSHHRTHLLSDALRLSVGIDNIFQNDPPFVASWTDGNTDTMTYDLLGRRGYLRVTYRR